MITILCLVTGLAACGDSTFPEAESEKGRTYDDFLVTYDSVYCGKRLVAGANAGHFEYIGSHYIKHQAIHYGKDNMQVYTCDVRRKTLLSPAQVDKDILVILMDADPKTFVLLGEGYSKDATKVFYGNNRVEGASTAGFKLFKNLHK